MKFTLTLNGEKKSFEENPEKSLLEFLRAQKLNSVRCGCQGGECTSCTVLLDGKAVCSCLVLCGVLNNNSVVTMEYFSKQPLYQEIMRGFETAGVQLCGFCRPGKIFAAYEILSRHSNPTREEIYECVKGFRECCVERDTLINGIIYAAEIHFEKERLKKNGKQ